MNATRRKKINGIIERLEALHDELCEIQGEIENVKFEEEESYENLPESLQYSERGEAMEEAVDTLDGAFDDMETVIDEIDDVKEHLEEIISA